jgi:hypothetical protein
VRIECKLSCFIQTSSGFRQRTWRQGDEERRDDPCIAGPIKCDFGEASRKRLHWGSAAVKVWTHPGSCRLHKGRGDPPAWPLHAWRLSILIWKRRRRHGGYRPTQYNTLMNCESHPLLRPRPVQASQTDSDRSTRALFGGEQAVPAKHLQLPEINPRRVVVAEEHSLPWQCCTHPGKADSKTASSRSKDSNTTFEVPVYTSPIERSGT